MESNAFSSRAAASILDVPAPLWNTEMNVDTGQINQQERRVRVGLLAGTVLCLVASGGILWWRYGGAVFNDLVLTTLAWCF